MMAKRKKTIVTFAKRFVCDGCSIHCHLLAESKPPERYCLFQCEGIAASKWWEVGNNNIVKT
jgi:hypothetical protein